MNLCRRDGGYLIKKGETCLIGAKLSTKGNLCSCSNPFARCRVDIGTELYVTKTRGRVQNNNLLSGAQQSVHEVHKILFENLCLSFMPT